MSLYQWLVRPRQENQKITTYKKLAQKWNLSTIIWQNLLFLLTLPVNLWCYAKRKWKSWVSSGCKLWNYRLVQNSGIKHSSFFDDSCEKIYSSKAFVDSATAGIHRGLSTIYIKHNLFHRSNLGRGVELQNTRIVLFKSPRDVMQVNTLSAKLGLGSKLVDWNWDTTSVPCRQLLIQLSLRTDDRLHYCTNNVSITSKIYIPDRPRLSKTLDDGHTKSLYFPSVPIKFPQMQKPFHSV